MSNPSLINGKFDAGDCSRRIGRDELNLADWKVGVAKYQQPRHDDRKKLDRFTTMISRKDGTHQRVTREAPASVGLPTAVDDDVILACQYLTFINKYESDVVHFQPSELITILGWPHNDDSRQRLKKSFERLTKVSITYTDTWYDRKNLSVAPEFYTGIFAEAKLVFRRGRPEKGTVPESYFQWVDSLFQNMKQGNLATIDLDFHFNLKKPGARHLHRHLNKRRHGNRRYAPYERDLKELACGHLGMQDCKDLKRNFHQGCVQELINQDYLVADSVAYIKVRPGIWRVRFDFSVTKSVVPPPIALVRTFYELWSGKIPKRILKGELVAAREIIGQSGEERAFALLPLVISTMKTAFPNAQNFGATRKYFAEAANSFDTTTHQEAEKATEAKRRAHDKAEQEKQRQEKQRIRAARLAKWNTFSDDEKVTYFERAERQTTSPSTLSLLRRRHFSKPPTIVLKLMDTLTNQ